MKTKLALFLIMLPATSAIAADKAAATPSEISASGDELSPVKILASQVSEIASTPSLTRKEQAKLIAKAVRVAVESAIDGVKDPVERLERASNLAAAAAEAGPDFSDTIISAVSSLPAFAKVEGAADQIQKAVSATIETTDSTAIANPAANPPRPPANPDFGGPNRGEVVVSPSS